MTNWMTLEEVARYLRLSTHAVYKLAQQGKIPACKLSSQWRFDPEELDRWIRGSKQTVGKRSELPFSVVLSDFLQEVRGMYGARLKGIYLYGSWARREAVSGSDVDLAVVGDDLGDFLECGWHGGSFNCAARLAANSLNRIT